MKVKIKSAKSQNLWYSQLIGQEINVAREENQFYLMPLEPGYSLPKKILKKDAELVLTGDKPAGKQAKTKAPFVAELDLLDQVIGKSTDQEAPKRHSRKENAE